MCIAFRIIPSPLDDAANFFPPFAVGNFTVSLMFLAISIHLLLFVFFGGRFWLKAFGFAAQLSVMLFFFGVAFQAMIEIVASALHKAHLDFWNLADAASHDVDSTLIISSLQQPLFVAVVLPTTLAVLYAIAAFVDSCNLEDVMIKYFRKGRRRIGIGVVVAAIYFFARCFNHVAHFVIPMTSQVLREERFDREIKAEFRRALLHILFPETFVEAVVSLTNKVGRTACGSILLGIEYIPMWSSQVVNALVRGKHNE